MQLYMKQKIWSIGDHFTVRDNQDQDRWFVQGEVFSFGKRLHIMDTNNVERALLWQKVWSFLPCYNIEVHGIVIGQVVKDFTFLKPHYHVEGMPLELSGDYLSHEYSLSENGIPIMRISKQWFTWGDSYLLDLSDQADELVCLCIALAVDCAVQTQRNSN